MKILVTGFEPFGDDTRNPALEAVEQASAPEGAELVRMQVPTVFGESIRVVTEAIEKEKPDAVIMVGQAGGRSGITPEKVAVNWQDARIPDNAGYRPEDCPVVPDGPAAYFSTLPVNRIRQRLADAGIPAAISLSAGSYVCNHLFYGVMHDLAEKGLDIPAGFIHVPFMTEQLSPERRIKAASMPLADIVRGLDICVKVVCRELSAKL